MSQPSIILIDRVALALEFDLDIFPIDLYVKIPVCSFGQERETISKLIHLSLTRGVVAFHELCHTKTGRKPTKNPSPKGVLEIFVIVRHAI